jgi:3-oxoacyl-[acyl-carrier protein] reductase
MIETGLRGRVVLVTGGAGGIGRATSLRFAQEHCRVAVWDLKQEGSADLEQELKAAGADAAFRKTDVADSKDVDRGVQELVARWGGVDVLVNNAAINRDALLVKWKDGEVAGQMSDDLFNSVVSVNLNGVFHCTRAVVPHMIRAKRGVILNASSIVGIYGNFGVTGYAATKSALIGCTKTWSRELGKYNIRVNAVAPGFVDTDMVRAIPKNKLDDMIDHTPLGRIGQPEEIAEAYVWLASDAAQFVTGTILSVDGGLVIGT